MVNRATLRVIECGPDAQPFVATFQDFWSMYPRRVARKAAIRAWERVPHEMHIAVLSSLFDWRRVWMARGELEYVPYPATWLNGERWEDELPSGYVPVRTVKVELREVVTPQPMPAHVRALLEQLREKLR